MKDAGALVAILSGAVIILGGLVGLARAVLHIRDDVRDNTRATRQLTKQVDNLLRVGGRLDRMDSRMDKMERDRGRR